MKKNLICVSCPLGCPIEVEVENGFAASQTESFIVGDEGVW